MRLSLLASALVMNFLINLESDRTAIAQQAKTVKQWTFNTDGDKEHWTGPNHLKDVAVQDGVPAGGYAPSPGWSPGTPVADRRGLLVPPDLPAGEYTLIAGLYEADTGQRLPVQGPAGEPHGDAVLLAVLQVE